MQNLSSVKIEGIDGQLGTDAVRDRVLAEAEARPASESENLATDLVLAKRAGYLLSVGQLTPHTFALAVPVFNLDGSLAGAMTVAGPESKVHPKQGKSIAQAMGKALATKGLASSLA